MTRTEPTATGQSFGLFRLLCLVAAVATAGAGVIHFMALSDHREHLLMAAFFLATGCAQLAWAVAIVLWPSRLLLFAGIAGNLGVVATWAITRTIGLSFVPGAEQPEAIGFPDAIATLFEVVAAGTAGLALAVPAGMAATLPAGRKAVAIAAAAVLLLTAPAALAGHPHGDHAHGDAQAAGHAHGSDAQGAHDHSTGGQHNDLNGKHNHLGGQHGDSHGQHAGEGGHGNHGGALPVGGHQHSDGVGGGHQHGDGSHAGHGGTSGHAGHGGPGHEGHHGAVPETFPQPKMWGTKKKMRIGPFYLPAVDQGGDAHYNRIGMVPQKPCQDCYITGIVPRLVYADGSTADVDTGPMLHHIVIFNTGKDDPTCERWNGTGIAGERIFASGNERTRFAMPRGFGYRASGGAPWGYAAEIMNHSSSAKQVYVEADVYTVPTSTKGMKPVTPVWLDVANCRDSEYTAPPGRSHKRWSWTSSLTGRIIGAGGHVHAGGVGMILRNTSTGSRICTSEAAYGTRGAFRTEVTQMSTCIWDRIGSVRKGQLLQIDTIYDSPGRALEGVMGIMMIAVYETNDVGGGSLAPAWNRRNPDTRPPEAGGHGH